MPLAEGLLLWGLRAWVAGLRRRLDVGPAIAAAFESAGAADAASLIDPLMSVVACGATRRVTIDCICRKQVSPDERRLIQAAALHQAGRGFEACFLLREMLAPAAARDAGALLDRLAGCFGEAALRFAWLPCDTDRHGFPAVPPVATLH